MINFLEETLGFSIWGIVKLFFILALVLYIIFAVVIVRQVKLMGQTISDKNNYLLSLIAWLHLAIALFVFLLAWIIL